MATIVKLLECLAANPRWSSGKASRIVYKRSGFEAWFDPKFQPSFFLLETLSITSQKFSKCRKNGIDRLRNGNLRRRSRCNANGDLLALETKYTPMDIKSGKYIPYATQAVKNKDLES